MPHRRRSVDVGGLALALAETSSGYGWGGWEETEQGETRYAEVLIDVFAHTDNAVNLEPLHLSPFIQIEDDVRSRLIQSLGSWHFEPHRLPEEEVLACAYILFEAVFRIEGMKEAISVPLAQLATFLQHLRQLYRRDNNYHNFQHALDVLQATYHFLLTAGVVPSVSILEEDSRSWKPDKRATSGSLISSLSNADIFALYIAAIGHDVGHPGLTNAFMKNAKTPLAELYDEKSVLERMHYSLLLSLMRHHGLGVLLDRPNFGQSFRKTLSLTVLATDMGLHADFMARFQKLVQNRIFDPSTRKILYCQAIIKCADISNPSRPYTVCQHWAAALNSEWRNQLCFEQYLALPPSVMPSKDPLSQARGQVFFSKTFASPLFQLTASAIPEMNQFADICAENLQTWEDSCSRLAADAQRDGQGADSESSTPTQVPEDFLNAFAPTLPRSFLNEYEASISAMDSKSEFFSGYSGSQPDPIAPNQPARLEIPTSPSPSIARASSIASSNPFCNSLDATAAIRAAYSASVRKKKSFHRSSWNPSPAEFTALTGCPLRAENQTSPHSPRSNFPSPLSPPSSSTVSPLTPASISNSGRSPLSVFQPVPSC
ncbi:hypothetical protein BDY19DRAFT_955703 [Irpex rosettiformis]|uniref:Uncharacterized protein n=1 Tax=Irpex rosettiformis TaxID=378272 RepID=A0ACB8TZA3_9APHY|nr:hypothetical protein BDY19DRAFT_955703 [Irpex rosettiformis]